MLLMVEAICILQNSFAILLMVEDGCSVYRQTRPKLSKLLCCLISIDVARVHILGTATSRRRDDRSKSSYIVHTTLGVSVFLPACCCSCACALCAPEAVVGVIDQGVHHNTA